LNAPAKTQIVIVGGGAGGLVLARKLGAKLGSEHFDVILVDRNPTHIWKPLLHEVATGSLDANLDEVGYRNHGHRWNYRFFLGSLDGIDRQRQEVLIAPIADEDGSELISAHRIRYDYLVLAFGAISNDFGVPGVRHHALFLDSRDQADRFRKKLLNHCLRVSRAVAQDPNTQASVKVAIVGAGATGVELAAELFNAAAGLRHYGLEVFDDQRLRVTLLESGPRILPALTEGLAEAAHQELGQLGVEVRTAARVVGVEAGRLLTADAGPIEADLIVWAAGVKGPDLADHLSDLETTAHRQLVTRPTLQTTRDERIFCIGDCAFFKPPGEERPVPPRAQSAAQMAEVAYHNILRLIGGRPLVDFVYRDHGSLVSLSRYSTVGSLMGNLVGGRMAIEGRLARLVYVGLYRKHLLAVHGLLRGLVLIVVGHVNQVVRPKLKLH
jgi:NADH dehydrogenase